jgi:hypothetical protein
MSKRKQSTMFRVVTWPGLLMLLLGIYGESDDPFHLRGDNYSARELRRIPGTCNGTFRIVKAGLPPTTPKNQVVLGTYPNGSTIDITPFHHHPLSVVVACKGKFSYLTLQYRNKTKRERSRPYALRGNYRNNYKSVSDLNVVGTKSIRLQGYSNTTKVFEGQIVFNMIQSKPTSPPVPSSPSTTPTTVPYSALTTAPSSAPTTVPTSAPATAPSSAPMSKSKVNSLFTNTTEFGMGSGVHVNYSSDQVQLNSGGVPLQYMWLTRHLYRDDIAVSVIKIDTNTGRVLGEYEFEQTTTHGWSKLVAVDHDGNVWVVHSFLGGCALLHIGLVENNQCEDRNNNGVIDTSIGLGDIKGWLNASVDTADDECIIHYFKYSDFEYITHLTVNDNNDIWIKGHVASSRPSNWTLIKGGGPSVSDAGTIIRTETSNGYGGYGGGLMSGEIMWSVSPLLRWNTSRPLDGPNGDPPGESIGPPIEDRNWAGDQDEYSPELCLDRDRNIWRPVTYSPFVVKYDKDGRYIGNYSTGEGVALYCVVDAREGGTNDVWFSTFNPHNSRRDVVRVANDGTYLGSINLNSDEGIAIDAKGKIWSIERENTVSRIDPTKGYIGQVDLVTDIGPRGYIFGYGDLTGRLIRVAPTQGSWFVVIDRIESNFSWESTTVTWHSDIPNKTSLTVMASSSRDGTMFSTSATIVSGMSLMGLIPVGRYIKVQVIFRRENREVPSPVLYDLRVQSF